MSDSWTCAHGVEDCAGAVGYNTSRKKVWKFRGDVQDESIYPLELKWDRFETKEAFYAEYIESDTDPLDTPFLWNDRERQEYFFCPGCHLEKMARIQPVITEDDDIGLVLGLVAA